MLSVKISPWRTDKSVKTCSTYDACMHVCTYVARMHVCMRASHHGGQARGSVQTCSTDDVAQHSHQCSRLSSCIEHDVCAPCAHVHRAECIMCIHHAHRAECIMCIHHVHRAECMWCICEPLAQTPSRTDSVNGRRATCSVSSIGFIACRGGGQRVAGEWPMSGR